MRIPTLLLLGSLSGLSTASARQRPSLAGEWVVADTAGRRPMVASAGDASFQTGTMGSGWGSPLTITQEPARLTIEYPWFSAYDLQPPIRLVFDAPSRPSAGVCVCGG